MKTHILCAMRDSSTLTHMLRMLEDEQECTCRMDAVGERLYKPVAEHCGTTEQTVERLIRHAVESAMDTVGVLRIYGFFGNTIDPMRGKPTNAEMIGMLAQHMRVTSAD